MNISMNREVEFSLWERCLMYSGWYGRKLRDRLVVKLGGYNRFHVNHLVYDTRRMLLELEGLQRESAILTILRRKLKEDIAMVDPELGKVYGYGKEQEHAE
jgi:hypothetical protein